MMAIPFFASLFIASISISASDSVSTAVGSSMIMIFTLSLESSLAISKNCLWPTGISFAKVFVFMSTPSFSIASFAFSSIVDLSKVSNCLPNTVEIGFFLVISRFNNMFSVAVNSGINENS